MLIENLKKSLFIIANGSFTDGMAVLSPDDDDAIMQCSRLSGYSLTWTTIALSLVIARPFYV
jgi:hypothetical protein